MSDRITSERRGLDHRIPPPIVLLVTAAAMSLAAAMLPPSGLGGLWSQILGTGFLLLAAVSGPPAFWHFARAGTTVDPLAIERASVLVTGGVYRWTRNPMYLAMASLLAALAAFLAQPVLVLGPATFVAYITRFQILPEERLMASRFGTAYEDYRRRVRRWI